MTMTRDELRTMAAIQQIPQHLAEIAAQLKRVADQYDAQLGKRIAACEAQIAELGLNA
jgi:hypothetical protein